jgi:hypothetical protein
MDLATASLSIPRPSPVPIAAPPAGDCLDPAACPANQATRPPESDGDQEDKEEPSSAERQEEVDEVDEASRESFLASDPPAFTPLHIGS